MGQVLQLRQDEERTAATTNNGKDESLPLSLGNLPPRRQRNADVRSREHLTPGEVERLISSAGKVGRHGHRDSTMLLIAYRHGLRVADLVAMRWDQVDLKAGLLHVRRRKNGTPSTHPLRGPELRRSASSSSRE